MFIDFQEHNKYGKMGWRSDNLKKLSLFILVFPLYNGVVLYLGWNVYEFLGIDAVEIFSIIWIIWAYSLLIGMISRKLSVFQVAGYYWFAFVQYGLMLFPIANLLIWITPANFERAIEWIIFALMIIIFAIGIYRAYSPVTRKLTVEVKNDLKAGEELKVVVGSDFHFGPVMGKGQLEKFVRKSNAENADLVFLAGDLVDDIPYWYMKHQLKDTMRELKSTYGVFGILGNHEYYGKQIPETVYQMEQSNIKMLLDETIEIPGVCMITGREDITNKSRKKLEDLKVDNGLPWLIMDHTPTDIDTPAQLAADLQVSGHTHRGQMWPNQLITKRTFPLDYGYVQKGSLHAITTSGFGFWGPPLRTNSRAELWAVTIKFTKA